MSIRVSVTVGVSKGAVVRDLLRGVVTALACTTAALVVGAAWAGTAAGEAKIVLFTAKYAGKATVIVTDNVAEISANGAGKGTLIGKSKITGKGFAYASESEPCVPFSGPGSMFSSTGTKLDFKVLSGSTGCGDESGQVFSISGRAQVAGGTKAFRKAKGALKFTGVYDRGQGTFSVKFTGKITVP